MKHLVLILLLISSIMISCGKSTDSSEDSEILKDANLTLLYKNVRDTSTVDIQIQLTSTNIKQVDFVGYVLYDKNMQKIDSVILREQVLDSNIKFEIANLVRGQINYIKPFLYQKELGLRSFEIFEVQPHSFIINGLDHQNSHETRSFTFAGNEYWVYAGVRPTNSIFLKGNKLSSFNENCEIRLKFKSIGLAPINIVEVSDSIITIELDKKHNNIAQKPKEPFSICIIEDNDTIAYFSNENLLVAYTDRPFLNIAEINDYGDLMLDGDFGNGFSCDSIFIDQKRIYSNMRSGQGYVWYHDTYRIGIDKGNISNLVKGVHRVDVYLNGYSDSKEFTIY